MISSNWGINIEKYLVTSRVETIYGPYQKTLKITTFSRNALRLREKLALKQSFIIFEVTHFEK